MEEYIEDLLIEFDEMGFMPTITMPDPEGYAEKWKQKIISAISQIMKGNIVIIPISRCSGKSRVVYLSLKKVREEIAQEIIDKVDDMVGGKLIAQALREIYLEEDL